MLFNIFKNTVFLIIISPILVLISCAHVSKNKAHVLNTKTDTTATHTKKHTVAAPIIVGANKTAHYINLLKAKRVGIVANQTSVIFKTKGYTHLVDSLIKLNLDIKTVFAPEHGFRGHADAGEVVKDGIDTKTGLPIISLYGKNKKPYPTQIKDLDIVIFDIQDVGARFYTYISTLHYVMEACAEANIPVLILDRPNPNGHYIDGPVLENKHKSFVGLHPIPVVHGMTIAEYAKMINGQQWLANSVTCKLHIITVDNYKHSLPYNLPIKPSPNLPNSTAINLYPSLCFFEGTNVSVGRGTAHQFQIIGSPYLPLESYNYKFTPKPNFGAKHPKHKNKMCYGLNLTNHKKLSSLNLEYLISCYNTNQKHPKKPQFFTNFFTKLAGTTQLQQQIEAGLTAQQIKQTWQKGLLDYNNMRQAYLLYK